MLRTIKDDIRKKFKLSNGYSFTRFYELFYQIRVLKYANIEMLKKIRPDDSHVYTQESLAKLEYLGYLKQVNVVDGQEIYIATDNVKPAIESLGISKHLIPFESTGVGEIDALGTASVVSDILAINFDIKKHVILYPEFPDGDPYIRPDALFVIREKKRYRLAFLEVEAKKPKWDEHIGKKIVNYKRLSKDSDVYNYWSNKADILGIPVPDINDFKFSVVFIGNITHSNSTGFKFVKNINDFYKEII